jgi:hypothetical protein
MLNDASGPQHWQTMCHPSSAPGSVAARLVTVVVVVSE